MSNPSRQARQDFLLSFFALLSFALLLAAVVTVAANSELAGYPARLPDSPAG